MESPCITAETCGCISRQLQRTWNSRNSVVSGLRNRHVVQLRKLVRVTILPISHPISPSFSGLPPSIIKNEMTEVGRSRGSASELAMLSVPEYTLSNIVPDLRNKFLKTVSSLRVKGDPHVLLSHLEIEVQQLKHSRISLEYIVIFWFNLSYLIDATQGISINRYNINNTWKENPGLPPFTSRI